MFSRGAFGHSFFFFSSDSPRQDWRSQRALGIPLAVSRGRPGRTTAEGSCPPPPSAAYPVLCSHNTQETRENK